MALAAGWLMVPAMSRSAVQVMRPPPSGATGTAQKGQTELNAIPAASAQENVSKKNAKRPSWELERPALVIPNAPTVPAEKLVTPAATSAAQAVGLTTSLLKEPTVMDIEAFVPRYKPLLVARVTAS